jgi:hypothetical protein
VLEHDDELRLGSDAALLGWTGHTRERQEPGELSGIERAGLRALVHHMPQLAGEDMRTRDHVVGRRHWHGPGIVPHASVERPEPSGTLDRATGPVGRNGRQMAEQHASGRPKSGGPVEAFEIAAWVRRSTAAQGISEKLADTEVVLAAARLLRPVELPSLTPLSRRWAAGAGGARAQIAASSS